jgi:hypothetical protein
MPGLALSMPVVDANQFFVDMDCVVGFAGAVSRET